MIFEPWMFGHGVDVVDRWQRLTGLSIVFFLLGIVVQYPLLISNHNSMQKIFSLLSLNQLFASEKSPFNVSRFQFIRHPNFLVFESFPWLSFIQKRLVELPPMILQAPLAFDSDLLRIMPLILCLRIFLTVQSEACLQCWNLHPWNVETIPYMIYQLEQCHHKLITSTSIRWASAALFFQLKQKIKIFCKCCLVNTKFDTVKIKVFVRNSKRYKLNIISKCLTSEIANQLSLWTIHNSWSHL